MKKWLTSFVAGALLLTAFSSAAFADESNDKDCSDFSNYDEVVNYWNSNGYTASNDPENLDGRGKSVDDGIPCEAPGGYDTSKINGLAAVDDSTEDTTKEETESAEDATTKEETESTEEEKTSETSVGTKDESTDSASKEDKASTDIGHKLPDTASNNPLLILVSASLAALGLLITFGRKKARG